jgi:membrane-bound inhibitor of C-type lysozyme
MVRRLALLAALMLPLAACSTAGGGALPPPPASAGSPSPSPSKPPARPPRPARPVPPAEAAPGADTAPIAYRCAAGKRFTAAWGLPGDRVRVSAGGVSKTLPSVVAASGARYSDGTFEIWGKGDEAMLGGFPGGPYKGCRAG